MVDVREELIRAREENQRIRSQLERARASASSQRFLRGQQGRQGVMERQQQLQQLQQTEQVLSQREQAIQQIESSINQAEAAQGQQDRIRNALQTYARSGSFKTSLQGLSREERNFLKEAVSEASEQAEKIGSSRAEFIAKGIIKPRTADERVFLAQLKSIPGIMSGISGEILVANPPQLQTYPNFLSQPTFSETVAQMSFQSDISRQNLVSQPTLPPRNKFSYVGEFTQLPANERSRLFQERLNNLYARSGVAAENVQRAIPLSLTDPFRNRVGFAYPPLQPFGSKGPTIRFERELFFTRRTPEESRIAGEQSAAFVIKQAPYAVPIVGESLFFVQGVQAGKRAFDTARGVGGFSYADQNLNRQAQQARGISLASDIFQVGLGATGSALIGRTLGREVASLRKAGVSSAEAVELANLRATDPQRFSEKKLQLLIEAQATLSKKEFTSFKNKLNKAFPTGSTLAEQERIASDQNLKVYRDLIGFRAAEDSVGIGEEFVPKAVAVRVSQDLKNAGLFKTIDEAQQFISGSEVSVTKGSLQLGLQDTLRVTKGSQFDILGLARLPKITTRPDITDPLKFSSVQYLGTGPRGIQAVRVGFIEGSRGRPISKTINYIEVPKDSTFGLFRTFKPRRASTSRVPVPSEGPFLNPDLIVTRTKEIRQLPEEFRFAIRRGPLDIIESPRGELSRSLSVIDLRRVPSRSRPSVREEDFLESLFTGKSKKQFRREFRRGISVGRAENVDFLFRNSPEATMIGGKIQRDKNILGIYLLGEGRDTLRAGRTLFTGEAGIKVVKVREPTSIERIASGSRRMRPIEDGPLVTITQEDIKNLPSILQVPRRQIRSSLPSYVGGEGGILSVGEFAGARRLLTVTDGGRSFIIGESEILGPKTITRSFDITSVASKGRSLQMLDLGLQTREQQDSRSLLFSLAPSRVDVRERIRIAERQAQPQMMLSLQSNQQVTEQARRSPAISLQIRPRTRTSGRPKPTVRPPFIRIETPESLLDSRKNRARSFLRAAYNVVVGRGKKARVIARNLPLGRALRAGTERNLADITASFKLVRSGTTAANDISFNVPRSLFEPSKSEVGRLVQRRGTRLSGRGEVGDIMRARRSKSIRWF